MTYLLDVNLLIALIDPTHAGHDSAHDWFAATGALSWATCPFTERGVLRIVSDPAYPNAVGAPAEVAPILAALRSTPGHIFWPDDISLIGNDMVDAGQLAGPGEIADCSLLALAVSHGGQLATMDRRLSAAAVQGGTAALHVIEGPA